MAMAEFPALPLWTDAFDSDTHHLDFEEIGVYIRLLVLLWRTPECRVPNDPSWICRRLGVDEDRFAELIDPIIKEFMHSDGNWLMQKRLGDEFNYLRRRSTTNRENAKSRWDNKKHRSKRDATRTQVAYAPTPTPTPQIKKGEGGGARKQTRLDSEWKPSDRLFAWAG